MIGMPSIGTTLPMASEIATHMLRDLMALIRLHRRLTPIACLSAEIVGCHSCVWIFRCAAIQRPW